jgi:hypothetical protein
MWSGAQRSPVEMPEFQVRRDVVGSRREGRRSLGAYIAQARGVREHVEGDRIGRSSARRKLAEKARRDGDLSAAMALAIVYPLMRRGKALAEAGSNEGASMKRKPSIRSLETVSLDEAVAYLDHAGGDELSAAYAIAVDRARLDGSHAAPDDTEVHHALFLLCRARGKNPPSFDEMRVELRRRIAA